MAHGLPFLRCTEKQILEEVLTQTRLGDILAVEDGALGLDIEIRPADSIDVDSPIYAGHGISAVGHPGEPLIFVSVALMYIELRELAPAIDVPLEPQACEDLIGSYVSDDDRVDDDPEIQTLTQLIIGADLGLTRTRRQPLWVVK